VNRKLVTERTYHAAILPEQKKKEERVNNVSPVSYKVHESFKDT